MIIKLALASFFMLNLHFSLLYAIIQSQTKGNIMVEKIIYDKNVIYKLTRRDDDLLIIKYNIKNKRAWFQTNSMLKRKAIDINRVVNL